MKWFSGPALLAYSVISKHDADTSEESAAAQKFIYRQEMKNSTQEQSNFASASHRGSQWVY